MNISLHNHVYAIAGIMFLILQVTNISYHHVEYSLKKLLGTMYFILGYLYLTHQQIF